MDTSVGPTPRSIALEGARDIVGLAIGYVPMAVAIGAAIAEAPLDRLAGWSGSFLITAGSAHLTIIELLGTGAGVVAAVTAGLAINARLIAYSAGLAPWFVDDGRAWRIALGFFIIDPTYLLAVHRFRTDDPGPALRRWYLLGMGSVLYPVWALAMGAGVVVGAAVPPGLELDKAATFMMIGLLALTLDVGRHRVAAAAGVAIGLASGVIPAATAPVLAGIVAALGLAVVGRRPEDTRHPDGIQEVASP